MATTATSRKAATRAKPSAPTAARERRKSNRIATMTRGRVGGKDVRVTDVSLGGVGFQTVWGFDVAAEYSVVIGGGPLYLEGRVRVVSVRQRADGMYEVGGVFV
jgi:hypothetical protein